jgi:hypothetical protein
MCLVGMATVFGTAGRASMRWHVDRCGSGDGTISTGTSVGTGRTLSFDCGNGRGGSGMEGAENGSTPTEMVPGPGSVNSEPSSLGHVILKVSSDVGKSCGNAGVDFCVSMC